jgi:hypothetical protein
MKKLLVIAGLGLLSLGGLPWAAQADPLTPTVEGDGYITGTMTDNRLDAAWGCTALTTGARASATEVTCTLERLDGTVIASETRALEGNASATAAVTEDVSLDGGLRICWKAEAKLTDGTEITDDTLPNCK